MGMISACFGGVIRDVLTNKVPLIFKKEIYASACLAGGFVYFSMRFLDFPTEIPTVFTVILVRLLVVKYELELPKVTNDIFGNKI